jgi:hypothetical protein
MSEAHLIARVDAWKSELSQQLREGKKGEWEAETPVNVLL